VGCIHISTPRNCGQFGAEDSVATKAETAVQRSITQRDGIVFFMGLAG
jgi:hypothetical protein